MLRPTLLNSHPPFFSMADQGIRIVKYYAWEAPFVEQISSFRNQEMDKVRRPVGRSVDICLWIYSSVGRCCFRPFSRAVNPVRYGRDHLYAAERACYLRFPEQASITLINDTPSNSMTRHGDKVCCACRGRRCRPLIYRGCVGGSHEPSPPYVPPASIVCLLA